MKISAKGILEIAENEGIVLGPYKDSKGVWTFGVGHTAGAGEPRPVEMPREDTRGWNDARAEQMVLQALALFDRDLDRFEARVNNAIRVPLAQHEFDALVSFDFNTGAMTWRGSSGQPARIVQDINAGVKNGDAIMGWTKPPEIIPRRKAEQALFRTGDYDANGSKITVWNAHGDGGLSRREAIDGNRLYEMMKDVGAMRLPPTPPQASSAPVTAPAPSRNNGRAVGIGAALAAAAAGVAAFWDKITAALGF